MLIVSSLAGAQDAFSTHNPNWVISLLSSEESAPSFDGLPVNNHLHLYLESDDCSATISTAAEARANEIINFIRGWDGAGNILIHCNRGVSRSMAAAFIILCATNPDRSERAMADILRNAAPHADPCLLMISHADEILERDGEMLDAIEEMTPPCSEIAAPTMTLPLAS